MAAREDTLMNMVGRREAACVTGLARDLRPWLPQMQAAGQTWLCRSGMTTLRGFEAGVINGRSSGGKSIRENEKCSTVLDFKPELRLKVHHSGEAL